MRERAKWQLILLEIVVLLATWALWLVVGGWAFLVGFAALAGAVLLMRSRRTDSNTAS